MIGPRLLPVTWYAVLLAAGVVTRHTAGGGENADGEMTFPGHGTTSTERESRDYCQLETFYAACSGAGLGSDEPLKVVSVLSARYGRMRQDGRCVKRDYGYVGCAADVLAHVDRLCSGRRVCDFPVAELHGSQPCPNDLTPYLEASYECVPVVTEPEQQCGAMEPADGHDVMSPSNAINVITRTDGYLASSVTMETGRGGPSCPWHIQVPIGQTINLTLINFARVGLPTDWTGPGGGVGQAAVRPKVCYQLADIRERTVSGGETVRTITVCEGAERLSHVYTSSSNSVYVDVIATKILNVHFLLHFQAVGCANPSALPPGIWLQRDGDHALMRCNTTGETWRITCSGSQWRGQTRVNCSQSASSSSAAAFPLDGMAAWDLSQFFTHEAFPLSILLVVAVGVAMGVFVGGVLLVCVARHVRRRREPVIIDDDDDYSLSHHHHHLHHQLPAAYLQLAGKTAGQDSPPRSPSDGRTLSDVETPTPGCAYCAVPTPGVGPDCSADGPTSGGDFDGSDGLPAICTRCGHQHRVHVYNHRNSADYVTGGQHLHHCHQHQQQHDVI